MVKLDPNTINELTEILRPFVESERERQSFLIAALGNDAPVLQHISWGGSVATFIPHMMHKLADFGGRQALCAVLEYGRSQMSVHEDVQQRINELIRQLDQSTSTISEINNIDLLVQRVRKCLHDKNQRQHGTIQLLDVAHPVQIERLYTDVNILEEPCSYSRLEIDELLRGRNQRDDFNRFGLSKVRERVSGIQAVKDHSKLMVLGKPGSGKTTFLQHVVIECNNGNLLADHIPILIKLRDFVRQAKRLGNFSLESHITFYLRGVCSEQEVTDLLEAGKILLLMDGLDEVPGADSDTVVDEIEFFLDKYDQNQLIITCRVQAQKYRMNHFSYLEIADFNSEQITTFVQKWFLENARNKPQGGETKAWNLLDKFNLPENKQISELAVTPILLSLTCKVFDDKGKFYSKPSELYEQGLEILLAKWDESRRINRNLVDHDLSIEQKRQLLAYLAVRKFEQEQYMLFEKYEIQGYIAEFLGIPLENTQDVLESIEAQHGLLLERAQRIYSFSHLTFQEYFAAKSFVDKVDWEGLVSHITKPHWREVFLNVLSLADREANKLLIKMRQAINSLVAQDKKIQEFLTWVNQKYLFVKAPHWHHPAAIRALYLDMARFINNSTNLDIEAGIENAFLLSCAIDPELGTELVLAIEIERTRHFLMNIELVFDIDFTHTITHIYNLEQNSESCVDFLIDYLDNAANFNSKIGNILRKLQHKIQDYKQQPRGQNWVKELRDAMIKIRNIGHDWQFSNEQKKLLQQYYDANKLLVDCLNSGCTVSKAVRQEIEDTLLLPIAEIEKRKHEN